MTSRAISFKQFDPSTWSVWCWGVYLLITGLALLVFPLFLLGLMNFTPSADVWVRMTGLLSVVLGFYYIQVARYQITIFFRWKITGHLIGVALMLSFYFMQWAPSALLMTAATDLIAATWTFIALHKQASIH